MEKEMIISGVRKVFKKIFGMGIPADTDTPAGEIEGWDSLNHVILIRELEKEFGIEFDLFDALELTSAAAIVEFIEKKINCNDHPGN